ncbi:MAG: DUF4239 domain-containing protein [Cyanobacteria bacterium SZAS TMP-1]|nr:DUF4239 domain-containing protein [Cyanobacteria bacterium SZAS TMP-1]
METIISGLFVFCLAAGAAIVGLLLLKKYVDLSSLANHQELVQATLSIVGTLYAVLLGFLVAGAVTFHENAEARVLLEANSLCDVFRFARGLPDPERSVIRNTCRTYNQAVLDSEWQQLDKTKGSPQAWTSYFKLWEEILAVPNTTQQGSNIQTSLMNAVQNLGESRRTRITMMKHELPPLVWVVVLTGSAILIGLMYLLMGEKNVIHSILIAIVTGVLCLNTLLLYVYSRPFNGAMKVRPDAFLVNQDMFKQSDTPATYDEIFGKARASTP